MHLTGTGPTRYSVLSSLTAQHLVGPSGFGIMDTRVLLANTNKRFQSIFDAIQILNQNQAQTAASFDAGLEVIYTKQIEMDNKLDAILSHLGIEVPSTASDETSATAIEMPASPPENTAEDITQLVQ